jgi:membrane-associated phospholipid phosphatase
MDIFETTGKTGPYTMSLIAICSLAYKPHMMFYFLVGLFMNTILNLVLKGLIKQPRPEFNTKQLDIFLRNNGLRYVLGSDVFGMPSGHAQTSFYILAFIYLVTRNIVLSSVLLLLSVIVVVQRVVYNEHTIIQVLVGSIVGGLFGIILYHIGKVSIM